MTDNPAIDSSTTEEAVTGENLRTLVVATLIEVAPHVEAENLRDDQPLHEVVGMDPTGWRAFVAGLHDELQVDIPEADYAKLVTLGDVVDYLQARLPG